MKPQQIFAVGPCLYSPSFPAAVFAPAGGTDRLLKPKRLEQVGKLLGPVPNWHNSQGWSPAPSKYVAPPPFEAVQDTRPIGCREQVEVKLEISAVGLAVDEANQEPILLEGTNSLQMGTKLSLDATSINVQGLKREKIGRPANLASLREIAAITRGKMVTASQTAELIDTIKELPEPEAQIRRIRLWASPFWAASMIGMLGVFWVGRKLVGVV